MKKNIKFLGIFLSVILILMSFAACGNKEFQPVDKDPNGAFVINIDKGVVLSPYSLSTILGQGIKIEDKEVRKRYESKQLEYNERFDLLTKKDGVIEVSAYPTENNNEVEYALNFIKINVDNLGKSKVLVQNSILGETNTEDTLRNFGDNFKIKSGVLKENDTNVVLEYPGETYSAIVTIKSGVLYDVEIYFNEPIFVKDDNYEHNILIETLSGNDTTYYQYFFNDKRALKVETSFTGELRNDILRIDDPDCVCYAIKKNEIPKEEKMTNGVSIEIVNVSGFMEGYQPIIDNGTTSYLRESTIENVPVYKNGELAGEYFQYK